MECFRIQKTKFCDFQQTGLNIIINILVKVISSASNIKLSFLLRNLSNTKFTYRIEINRHKDYTHTIQGQTDILYNNKG